MRSIERALLGIMVAGAAASAALAAPPVAAPLDLGAPTSSERAAFQACLKTAGRTCVGRIQAACLHTGADFTAGAIACAEKERRLWDERAQGFAALLRAGHSPAQVATLDSAIVQFEAWRTAKCAYAATLYEGGSLARVLAADCAMKATADWANELSTRLADESQ